MVNPFQPPSHWKQGSVERGLLHVGLVLTQREDTSGAGYWGGTPDTHDPQAPGHLSWNTLIAPVCRLASNHR